MNNFIDNIITEASLDARIPDGMVDLKNTEHLQVVAEAMYDACGDEKIVNEFVQAFMEEGKHPERQAYNKDGWLVTFPSAEYKQKAIKKGTHFSSDPTHGKGGMNLYYKKRGKQKRQTQQAVSATQQVEPATGKPTPQKKPATAPQAKPTTAGGAEDSATRSARLASLTAKSGASKEPSQAPEQAPADTTEPSSATAAAPADKQAATKPAEVPAIDVPVVTTPPDQYASVSKKFASQKGWTSTPYGEYRDAEGNPVAVTGLTGEVVPIRSNDREEYKIFAEKNMPKV